MPTIQNQVLIKLQQILLTNLGKIDQALTEFTTTQKVKDVLLGSQNVVPGYPVIRLEIGPVNSEWGATRCQDETYNYNVRCLVRCSKREVAEEWTSAFTKAVMNVLNTPSNLEFDVTDDGKRVYNAYATGGDVVTNLGEGIFEGVISYFAQIWNIDHNM